MNLKQYCLNASKGSKYNNLQRLLTENELETASFDWDDGGWYVSMGEAFMWIMPDKVYEPRLSHGSYLTRSYLYLYGLYTKIRDNFGEIKKQIFDEVDLSES